MTFSLPPLQRGAGRRAVAYPAHWVFGRGREQTPFDDAVGSFNPAFEPKCSSRKPHKLRRRMKRLLTSEEF